MAGHLTSFRQGKGWTQSHFAGILGVDPSTLARWERGERDPTGTYRARVNLAIGE